MIIRDTSREPRLCVYRRRRLHGACQTDRGNPKIAEVDAITTCYNLPFWGASGNNVYLPGDDRELFNIADLYDVGNDYLNVLEIPIVEGQYFTENTTSSQEILVSRNFIEYMNLSPTGRMEPWAKTVQITGHDTKSESMPLFTIRAYSRISA